MSDTRQFIVYLCAAGKAWGGLSILYFSFGLFLALDRVEMPVLVMLLALAFTAVGFTNLACAKWLSESDIKGRDVALWTGVAALLLYAIFLYPILPQDDVRVVKAAEVRGSMLYELVLLLTLQNKHIKEYFLE